MEKLGINEGIEVITKLSVVNYETIGFRIIRVVLHTGKRFDLTNDDKHEIEKLLLAWKGYEPAIATLFNYWFKYRADTLYNIIKGYKSSVLRPIHPDLTVCKLFFDEKPVTMLRNETGREWIDYNHQIDQNNMITDTSDGNGLWTAPVEILPSFICNDSLNRYGTSIMILKTVKDELYVQTIKNEIIGKQFICMYKGSLLCKQTWIDLIQYLGDNYYLNIDVNAMSGLSQNETREAFCSAFPSN